MTFTEHAKQKGIDLLKDDRMYLINLMRQVPADTCKHLLRRYVEVWLENMGAAKSQNRGRRAANEWVLSMLQK